MAASSNTREITRFGIAGSSRFSVNLNHGNQPLTRDREDCFSPGTELFEPKVRRDTRPTYRICR